LTSHGFSKTQISKINRTSPTLSLYDPHKTLAPKIQFLISIGFSKTDIPKLEKIAFRAHPFSMSLSEEKITRGLEILVNEMGCEVAEIARSSHVLFYNLENRIKPRCRVIKVLISKGLLKTVALTTFLKMPETRFLVKFVSKYEDRVPELLNIYQEREII
jgi:mTERF domain-containing protein